ncbi:MAG: hypothetical protein R3Y64_10655 [Peptostreptococcaceae bacterium]
MENCCEEMDLVLENEKTIELLGETFIVNDYICKNCGEVQAFTKTVDKAKELVNKVIELL